MAVTELLKKLEEEFKNISFYSYSLKLFTKEIKHVAVTAKFYYLELTSSIQ